MEQIRQTIRAAGELNEESLSDDAKVLLLRIFNDWKRTSVPTYFATMNLGRTTLVQKPHARRSTERVGRH
jgi:hypothetical protein